MDSWTTSRRSIVRCMGNSFSRREFLELSGALPAMAAAVPGSAAAAPGDQSAPAASQERWFSGIGAGRSVVRAGHAMVASSQPLASQVGIEILKRGGNAVDAAIAMAAMLNVTEPNMTGVGGDAFMMVHEAKTRKLEDSTPAAARLARSTSSTSRPGKSPRCR